MCLPGQRDAAKLRYQHFTNVRQKFSATICVEQPCVMRIQRKCAMVFWVHTMFERHSEANGKPPKLCKTPCNTSSTTTSLDAAMEKHLSETLSESSDLWLELQCTWVRNVSTCSLQRKASQLSWKAQQSELVWILADLSGTWSSARALHWEWEKQARVAAFRVAYLVVKVKLKRETTSSKRIQTETGQTVQHQRQYMFWMALLFGQQVELRSVSVWVAQKPSGMRQLQQFAILSSSIIFFFLTDDEVGPVILHTDNSAVKMLSNKLGAGRLRHIKGRLLWLQAKVLSGDLCIKQVKALYNIADRNTKSLAKDRHLFLLHMLGFVCSGEKVGETEFTRVQAKEMLKQQVNMISENVSEQTGQIKTSRTNRMAKQFLRALSVFSVMSLAEGHGMSNMAQLVHGVSNALSWWCGAWSPSNIFSIVLLFLLAVLLFMHMTPGSGSGPSSGSAGNRSRSRSRIHFEPGAEPPTSRYPANPRSLGMKYPNVCSGENFRPEAFLYWLCDRAGKRIVRGNRILTNNMRKGGLQQMLKLCMEGLSPEDRENMIDYVWSMTGLTDDDYSPRYMCSEETVMRECEQGVRAFDIAAEMVRRMEEEAENGEVVETEEGRYDRYMRSELDDVSDPGYWHDIRAEPESEHSGESDEMASDPETFEEKKHRYMLCEKHEASDGELWQKLHDAQMAEVRSEEHLEAPASCNGFSLLHGARRWKWEKWASLLRILKDFSAMQGVNAISLIAFHWEWSKTDHKRNYKLLVTMANPRPKALGHRRCPVGFKWLKLGCLFP